MNHDTQVALIRRLLAHIDARTTDTAADSHRQPVTDYTSSTVLDRELARIFRRVPLPVAHCSQVAGGGDFITRRVAEVPVLLVRDPAGPLRAFINVCRHRGTQVVAAPCGRAARSFACPYHGWTYGPTGALIGQPHRGGFPGDQPGQPGTACEAGASAPAPTGLVPLPCAEAAGLVWVSLDPDAPLDMDAWLGPLAAELESYQLASHHVYDPRTFELSQNWKLLADGALETYHIRVTHKDTIWPLFNDNLGLVDVVAPHIRTVFPKRSLTELRQRPPSGWRLREHANILYLLFPSTILLVQPDHVVVLLSQPLGTGRVRVDGFTLVPEPPTTDSARRHWDANDELFYRAVAEDFALGDSIQAGLASGANQSLLFGRFEHGLTAFHRIIAEHLARA